MSLTHTVLDAFPHPANVQNIVVRIEHVDKSTGEKFVTEPFGNDITPAFVAQHCGLIDRNWSQRKTSLAAVQEMKGEVVTPTAPEEDSEFSGYLAARNKLLVLEQIKSEDPDLQVAKEAAKVAVETYLKANPEAIGK